MRKLKLIKNDTAVYDFLVVGAGLYGSVMARELSDRGMHVAVIEKRSHTGGSAYTENEGGIIVHKYGPHIFHTDNEEVWRYVNRFADFRSFINRPAAVYKGEMYSLPFNMKTFEKMWGVTDPDEARQIIQKQSSSACPEGAEPRDLEEQAVSMVGTDIYERLVKGYSEKQWGRKCCELPPYFIKRLPVRFDYDDSYFSDEFQGIPEGGYTPMIEKMLSGIDVMTDTDYLDPENRARFDKLAKNVVFSGPIDAFYGYRYGRLEYRSIRFEKERIEGARYFQDRAVINYTGTDVPYTRVTEHKHFDPGSEAAHEERTIITREYPVACSEGNEPFYPLADEKNSKLYKKYLDIAASDSRVHFGGRLGSFRYYDMDDVIASALADAETLTKSR